MQIGDDLPECHHASNYLCYKISANSSSSARCRRQGRPPISAPFLLVPLTPLQHCDAGVKNIHAYSWLAHSRKYLESVEREKRHSHAAKVPRFSQSLSVSSFSGR